MDYHDLGRWFFEDVPDAEIRAEINATFIALVNFENDAPEVPARDPLAHDLREKIARFERELADREAERGNGANS